MRLKKLLTEAELDKAMLKELAGETCDPEPSPGCSAHAAPAGSGSPNEKPAPRSASIAPASAWASRRHPRTKKHSGPSRRSALAALLQPLRGRSLENARA